MSVCVFVCVSLCVSAVPAFLHCDPAGPQLSPGSMSPTGYPRSQLSWPESKTDRDDEGGETLFMCACWSVCKCDHRSDNIPQSQQHVRNKH